MGVGANLKAAREAAGLKQKDVAVNIGIAVNTLCCYETDKLRISADSLRIFAESCGVSVDDILGTGKNNVDYASVAFRFYTLYRKADPRIRRAINILIKDE